MVWLAGGLTLLTLPLQLPAAADPDPIQMSAEKVAAGPVTGDEANLPDYSIKSDYELTEIGARWDDLSRSERAALLREVKLRMAQRKGADGVLVIKTQRRYGRIYRSDGRYLRIETRVVRVHPADGDQVAQAAGRGNQPGAEAAPVSEAGSEFGTGFEQRVATETEVPAKKPGMRTEPGSQGTPILRVSDPS